MSCLRKNRIPDGQLPPGAESPPEGTLSIHSYGCDGPGGDDGCGDPGGGGD